MIAPQHVWYVDAFNVMIDTVVDGAISNAARCGIRTSSSKRAQMRELVIDNFNSTIIPAGNA